MISLDSANRARNCNNSVEICGNPARPVVRSIMANLYRIFFRDGAKAIVGRDDFRAEDDASAMVVGHMLADACADLCTEFDLWQGTRRVDGRFAMGALPRGEKIADIVIER